MVFGAIEAVVRGGDESICSNLPNLAATYANSVSVASGPVLVPIKRPVIFNAVLEAIRVPPPPVMERNWNTTR